jgi:hypothetical protein
LAPIALTPPAAPTDVALTSVQIQNVFVGGVYSTFTLIVSWTKLTTAVPLSVLGGGGVNPFSYLIKFGPSASPPPVVTLPGPGTVTLSGGSSTGAATAAPLTA